MNKLISLFFVLSPALTWRDVQHIIVKTSRRGHLSASDWQSNGAGYDGRLKYACILKITYSTSIQFSLKTNLNTVPAQFYC